MPELLSSDAARKLVDRLVAQILKLRLSGLEFALRALAGDPGEAVG